jgi:hypothetical protein
MIEINIAINRENTIAKLRATRIHPKRKPKNGELCTYQVSYSNIDVDKIQYEYGCAINLSIYILQVFKDKEQMYKTLALFKKLENYNEKKN